VCSCSVEDFGRLRDESANQLHESCVFWHPCVVPFAARPASWVLLRGLGREARHWFDFPQQLSATLGVPVHCIDLPGIGARDDTVVPCTIDAMAHDLANTVEAQALQRPLGVCGISLGGMVAMSLAGTLPVSVSHLVMINASSRLSQPFDRLLPSALGVLLRAARISDDVEREQLIHSLVTNGEPEQVLAWAERAAQLPRRGGPQLGQAVRQLVAALQFKARRVPQPTLVLSAQGDRMVAPGCSRRLANHLGAAHESHPTAGHDLPLEDPQWVIERMKRWLATDHRA